ncbi:hypothetical protein W01_05350 [Candidatus Nitrotoga sp. AM1P]|nr:hypothetical protein W01_05350 [Candidatus Nitrotoga sp. AM1P]
MTKYIHKDFENSARSAKRYWHTKKIEEIKVIKFWVWATNFHEALGEARDAVAMQGIDEIKIWGR